MSKIIIDVSWKSAFSIYLKFFVLQLVTGIIIFLLYLLISSMISSNNNENLTINDTGIDWDNYEEAYDEWEICILEARTESQKDNCDNALKSKIGVR